VKALLISCPPVVVDADAFTPVTGEKLHAALSEICRKIRQAPMFISRAATQETRSPGEMK
jgi:hypothetical protein